MSLPRGLAVLLLLGLVSGGARAETANEAKARRYFEEGSSEYALGEFHNAAEKYKLAYRAKSDPVILYNIAQAYRLANEIPQALFFYRSFLRSVPNAENRDEVEDRIRRIEIQMKQNETPPNTPLPPGTKGGAPSSSEAHTRVQPSTESSAPRPVGTAVDPEKAKPQAGAGEPNTAPTSAAAASPPDAANVALTAHPEQPRKQPIYKKWWLWTAVGVVVVGAGLGVGLGLGLHSGPPSSKLGTTPLF